MLYLRNYILSENGNDYKANLHCHSTVSDGRQTVEELKKDFMEKGYSIIAFTDHDVFIRHNDLSDENFLALNGYEVEFYGWTPDNEDDFSLIKAPHFNVIALDPDIEMQQCFHRTRYFIGNGVQSKWNVKFDESKPDYVRAYDPENINFLLKSCRDAGFYTIYNHPVWSLENILDYKNYTEIDGFEIMNGSSHIEGFGDFNFQGFDDLLRMGRKISCVAGDDNHGVNGNGIAWTVIRADNLDYKSVAKSIKEGNMYASNGPEIKELYEEDGKIYAKTSDAAKIIFSTGIRHAKCFFNKDKSLINEAVFETKDTDKYVRVTVVGADGSVAFSNPYYVK